MTEIVDRKNPVLPPVALGLIIGAAGWYLLRELTPLLRPLLLAIFLCYVIIPSYLRIRSRFPGPMAIAVMAGGAALIVYLLSLVVYDNVLAFQEQLPRLTERAKNLIAEGRAFMKENLPWLVPSAEDAARMDEARVARLRDSLAPALNFGANLVAEAALVAVYVIFLLIDVRRWPNRLRKAFHRDQGENVLGVVGRVNAAIISYFRVQVIVSLLVGIGATAIMWATNTSFPVLWGLLNFFGNFIPYLGSVVGYSAPVVFGFLDHESGWEPVVAAGLMLALHLTLAYAVVPMMTGKAVGLSPLVILVSLAFWGLCWGVIGMILAVPLTVIVKIVLDNIESTRPLAIMLGDE
jgi:AI-2 transport protein TqsA